MKSILLPIKPVFVERILSGENGMNLEKDYLWVLNGW